MIKYYPKLILTFNEIKNSPSLIIHGLTGCMFHCFHCFNYDELVKTDHPDAYEIEDVISYIQKQENLFENIIFSGGEFLLAPLESLIGDLRQIKAITDKPVIIYTTGIDPVKVKKLFELGLVQGYHTDMKLPYHLLTDDDYELIKLTLGIRVHSLDVIHKMLESIHFIIENDLGYSQIRSVKYPFLDESAFHECKCYIQKLNDKYNKNIPYYVNRFILPETNKKEG